MAESGTVVDPYSAYNFKLEVQGVTEGHFTQCEGLAARVTSIKYREGGVNQVVRRLRGRVEYADVTLRYGLTSSTELWNWFMSAVNGDPDRRNVSIVLLGNDGVTEALRWNLGNAWPAEWRGALLDALGQEAAIETLTLTFESLERA